MTKEEAIAFFKDMNECTYGNLEAVEMAISALSEELSEDGTLTVHVSDGSKVKRVFVMGDNIFGGLYYPDSAKTDTAKPEEGAELIDRRQIKWYGCDHEGHIKGIDCDTADCSKCFYATVEHDEVMSLPVYRIPDSAENKGEWIPVSERLPEEAFPCYVTIEEDDRFGEPYANIYPEFVGYDGETWNDSEGKPIPFEVIAWQRKPEPYKKVGE